MIESVSRRALSGSSGSYHVRGAELARNRRLKSLSAIVTFLDDTQHTFQLDVNTIHSYRFNNEMLFKYTKCVCICLQKRAKGQVLLDLVFQHLELIEKDYFGLQYSENGVSTTIPTSDAMVTYFKSHNCM